MPGMGTETLWIDEETRFDPDGGLCSSYGEYCVTCAARNRDPVPEREWQSNADALHFVEKLNRQGFVLTSSGKGRR